MPDQNIYERLSDELGRWHDGTVDRLAKDIVGGKRPPFKVALSPQQKVKYFMAQPDQKKFDLMQQMDEAERKQMARLLGGADNG